MEETERAENPTLRKDRKQETGEVTKRVFHELDRAHVLCISSCARALNLHNDRPPPKSWCIIGQNRYKLHPVHVQV